MKLSDPMLGSLAETVTDLEGQRKAAKQRMEILMKSEPDEDGIMRGSALSEDHPAVLAQLAVISQLEAVEKMAIKNLEKAMKAHPLGGWVEKQNGLGLKTIARFMAEVGDPYWMVRHAPHPDNPEKLVVIEDRPRTFDELKAYVGLDVRNGEAPRRRAGQQSDWKGNARTRLYNCVDPIIKNRNSPYRKVYDQAKEKYAGQTLAITYNAKLKAGDEIPKWLVEKRARRAVMAAILKDLYKESKRIHTEGIQS